MKTLLRVLHSRTTKKQIVVHLQSITVKNKYVHVKVTHMSKVFNSSIIITTKK